MRRTSRARSRKQARRKSTADDEGDALPFFYPKPPTGPLPKIGHLKPQQVGLPDEPRRNRESHQLLRAIDVDHRARHDFDGRTELFAAGSPTAVEPGSVLLVEQISCRSSPRKMAFAGVLIAVSRKGLMSTITLKNYVLGTGVEMVFPIYSPMVTRIKVLKRVEGFAKGRDNVYALRDRPALAPLSFSSIDGMVMKDAEIERKLSANKK
ncbi:hypothetical protein DFJ73DRAFT_62117 [Zopfochytrium polystomum]|nr:hypothetical protein DFJ73DRAFT_61448 [Zopfochytrium polystomum]KAI9332479.1 hypothetical protein DFJ73DRAFT_62117 [Zopfochytrium polystomum]